MLFNFSSLWSGLPKRSLCCNIAIVSSPELVTELFLVLVAKYEREEDNCQRQAGDECSFYGETSSTFRQGTVGT